MAAATIDYQIYEVIDAKVQVSGSPALVEYDVYYANQMELQPSETTLTFEGDASDRNVYITSGYTVNLRPDSLPMYALTNVFAKDVVATPASGLADGVWFGDIDEVGGASCGLWLEAYAIKRVAATGAESIVQVRVWFPKGTLTFVPGGLQTKQKQALNTLRFSAVRTATDVNGTALTSVPTGGAFYLIAEKSS